MPSTSPSRGLRVVNETDACRPKFACCARREIVVFPAPEGADRINIIPRRVRRCDDTLKTNQARRYLQIRVLPGAAQILLNRSGSDDYGTSPQLRTGSAALNAYAAEGPETCE